jgi:hypothetical protein
MNADLEIAVTALSEKALDYTKLWKYYDGDQPLIYNNEKLRQIFHGLDARFTLNWCAVVADSVLDRLSILGATISQDKTRAAALAQVWAGSGLSDEIDTIHEEIAVVGESFVIAWPDPATEEIEAYHNDARLIHVEYSQANPRLARFGAKWWRGENNRIYLTLYYPDRFEYYRTRESVKSKGTISAAAFEPDPNVPSAENGQGQIPIFHFRSNRRKPASQLTNAIEPQDAINKLFSDVMVAAEFGAFRQRYVISQAGIGKNKLKNSPNEIWDIPGGQGDEQPTQVGQFDATSLDNYLDAMDKLAMGIGIITRTPRHYFYAQGGDPSGEALVALEAPLNKKTQRLINTLIPTWQRLAAFLLSLQGVAARPQEIYINYDKPETIQPKTQAEIRKTNRQSGIPLVTILRDEGWTESDLDELRQDLADEAADTANYANAALGAAQRKFDQGIA